MADKEGAVHQPPKIEPLDKKHDRVAFSCGDNALDTYLKERASQEAKKKIAATFATVDRLTNAVIGFYALSATRILLADLPNETARKLPKYPHVPATLLGRLAIDNRYQGRGYGEIVIINALCRAFQATTEVDSYTVVVDATNERARSFYEPYTFCSFPARDQRSCRSNVL